MSRHPLQRLILAGALLVTFPQASLCVICYRTTPPARPAEKTACPKKCCGTGGDTHPCGGPAAPGGPAKPSRPVRCWCGSADGLAAPGPQKLLLDLPAALLATAATDFSSRPAADSGLARPSYGSRLLHLLHCVWLC